ncbi:MAG: transporter substrate-binding domain-containing protein, partial [Candidatus Caldatribacteriaceae bacterium]
MVRNKSWGLLLFLASLLFVINPVRALTLKVGVYHNPPLVFQDEQGNLTGLYPRILEFIAQREGWKIEYSFDTFANHLESLKGGDIDLLVAIAYSPEWAQIFDLTQETVWINWGMIYTSPNLKVQSFLDLNEKTIFGVKGDIYTSNLQIILQGFGLDYRLVEVGNYEEVFHKIKNEPHGIGVVSRIFGLQFGELYGLRESPLVFSPVSLRFASLKDKHPEILATLDRWIDSLKEDPRSVYHQAIHEFLEIHKSWSPPRWLIFLLALILGILGILFFLNRLLQFQIQKK